MKTKKESATTSNPLMNDMQALVNDAESMASNPSGEHSAETLANLRERFEAAQERFGELYAEARTKVVAGAKCADTAIRDNPYQSLAIALGVGVLIGALIGRRTR